MPTAPDPKAILFDLDDTILDDSGCIERFYELALSQLWRSPADTWMVGDNLEWDVAAPQELGIYGIWVDALGKGLPAGSSTRPDRVVRHIVELQSGVIAGI